MRVVVIENLLRKIAYIYGKFSPRSVWTNPHASQCLTCLIVFWALLFQVPYVCLLCVCILEFEPCWSHKAFAFKCFRIFGSECFRLQVGSTPWTPLKMSQTVLRLKQPLMRKFNICPAKVVVFPLNCKDEGEFPVLSTRFKWDETTLIPSQS